MLNSTRERSPAEKRTLIRGVLDMGESIYNACFNLWTDPCIDACDTLLFRLERFVVDVKSFRKALVAEFKPRHSRGLGEKKRIPES